MSADHYWYNVLNFTPSLEVNKFRTTSTSLRRLLYHCDEVLYRCKETYLSNRS